jgi:hypothetical protein
MKINRFEQSSTTTTSVWVFEGPLARRHDTFALSYLSWIPDCRMGIA